MNQSAIDRGLFRSSCYKTYVDYERGKGVGEARRPTRRHAPRRCFSRARALEGSRAFHRTVTRDELWLSLVLGVVERGPIPPLSSATRTALPPPRPAARDTRGRRPLAVSRGPPEPSALRGSQPPPRAPRPTPLSSRTAPISQAHRDAPAPRPPGQNGVRQRARRNKGRAGAHHRAPSAKQRERQTTTRAPSERE